MLSIRTSLFCYSFLLTIVSIPLLAMQQLVRTPLHCRYDNPNFAPQNTAEKIIFAVKNQNYTYVDTLLQISHGTINCQDKYGWTPLAVAAHCDAIDENDGGRTQRLVATYAADDTTYAECLNYAVRAAEKNCNSTALCDLFFTCHAPSNTQLCDAIITIRENLDNKTITELDAIKNINYLLIPYGNSPISLNLPDRYGRTAFSCCAGNQAIKNIIAQHTSRERALTCAIAFSNTDTIEELINIFKEKITANRDTTHNEKTIYFILDLATAALKQARDAEDTMLIHNATAIMKIVFQHFMTTKNVRPFLAHYLNAMPEHLKGNTHIKKLLQTSIAQHTQNEKDLEEEFMFHIIMGQGIDVLNFVETEKIPLQNEIYKKAIDFAAIHDNVPFVQQLLERENSLVNQDDLIADLITIDPEVGAAFGQATPPSDSHIFKYLDSMQHKRRHSALSSTSSEHRSYPQHRHAFPKISMEEDDETSSSEAKVPSITHGEQAQSSKHWGDDLFNEDIFPMDLGTNTTYSTLRQPPTRTISGTGQEVGPSRPSKNTPPCSHELMN